MLLSRHCAGTYPETSSHAPCLGTLGHSRLSSLSHRGLIWHKEWKLVCARYSPLQQTKAQAGQMKGRTLSPNPRTRGKKPPPPSSENTLRQCAVDKEVKMELLPHSLQRQSSHLAEPLWTDPGENTEKRTS